MEGGSVSMWKGWEVYLCGRGKCIYVEGMGSVSMWEGAEYQLERRRLVCDAGGGRAAMGKAGDDVVRGMRSCSRR